MFPSVHPKPVETRQDLVFCPNVTVESLLPLLRQAPEGLDLERPVAATCRSGEEAEELLTLMEQLGAQAGPKWWDDGISTDGKIWNLPTIDTI